MGGRSKGKWWVGLKPSQPINESIGESKLPRARARGGIRTLNIGLTRF